VPEVYRCNDTFIRKGDAAAGGDEYSESEPLLSKFVDSARALYEGIPEADRTRKTFMVVYSHKFPEFSHPPVEVNIGACTSPGGTPSAMST
jgi:hypothetical protein